MIKILNLIGALMIMASCDDPNQECCNGLKEVELGEPFSIAERETINVQNSIIELTFVQLLNDSLCPEDVECLTQGTLSISININGTAGTLAIGDAASPLTAYKNYTIELQRLVYPTKQTEKDNNNSTYAVQMLITKS